MCRNAGIITRTPSSRQWLAGVLITLIVSAAVALEPGEAIREQQLREQDHLDHLQERHDVFLPESRTPAPAAPLPENIGGCVPIQQLVIQGAPKAWLRWLQTPAPVILPKCMSAQEINAVVGTVFNRVLAQGYLTSRIDLLAPALADGIIAIRVQPGYIGEIRTQEGQADLALRSAFPVGAGDILNIRDIEQALEQISRPKTQHARVDLLPGTAFATSDVVVRRERQFPLYAGLSLDNSGSDATGRWQASGYLVWDRFLQLNDTLILSHNQDSSRVQTPGSRGNSLVYLLPWGNWTWSAHLGQYQYRQAIVGRIRSLTASGRGKSWSLSAGRLLHRSQSTRTELTAQLTQKRHFSYIENQELTGHSRCLTIAGLSVLHRHYLRWLTIDVQLGIQRGVDWFNAEAVPYPLPVGYPNARQRVYHGKIATSLPFKLANTSWRWGSELRWQYSPDVLFPSEQFSIGGHYTVRGFKHSLAGSGGQYWRNDLIWSLLPAENKRRVALYLGVDVGRIQKTIYTDPVNVLASWTVGAHVALSKHIQSQISLEHPIQGPAVLSRGRVVYFKIATEYGA